MAVRLKDIARDLGVSTVTVSKVLRGNPDISHKTRQRVLERMRALNYQPNLLARGLASGRTYTMGLIVPDLVQPFFAELAKSISGVLRTSDQALLIASSEENPTLEQSELRTLLRRGVDVLLLASCQPRLAQMDELAERRVPCLLLDRDHPRLRTSFVGSDDYRAGRLATEHLLETGRQRIAHMGGRGLSPSTERLRGFQEAMRAAGRSVPKQHVLRLEHFEECGEQAGWAAMRQLLRTRPRPDAVFCYNDLTAIGAMEAVFDAGLRVPEDVAVVGCGNMRYGRYLRVPLSSIDQHSTELGEQAGRLALALAEQPDRPPERIRMEPHLVVRRSTQIAL